MALRVRPYFEFPTKDRLHWLPGHMQKGMRIMQTLLRKIDLIIEVHDARLPFTGRNPLLTERLASIRPHILLLNKADLADASLFADVQRKLVRQYNLTKVFHVNLLNNSNTVVSKQLIPAVTKLIGDVSDYDEGLAPTKYCMVTGVPNVGKSTLINALRATHMARTIGLMNRKAHPACVGAQPGVTRTVSAPIWVSQRPPIMLYDSPGVIDTRTIAADDMMRMACCGMFSEEFVGESLLADYMLYWMNRNRRRRYATVLGLPAPTDDVSVVLRHLAQSKDFVEFRRNIETGRSAEQPNMHRAACDFIQQFRTGLFGRFHMDLERLRADSTRDEPYAHLELSPEDSSTESFASRQLRKRERRAKRDSEVGDVSLVETTAEMRRQRQLNFHMPRARGTPKSRPEKRSKDDLAAGKDADNLTDPYHPSVARRAAAHVLAQQLGGDVEFERKAES